MILQCSNVIAFFLFRFRILRQQAIVRYKLSLLYRGGVQGTRLEAEKKNPRSRPRTDFPRTDPLETKDRNARGQGPRTQCASVLQKKSWLNCVIRQARLT